MASLSLSQRIFKRMLKSQSAYTKCVNIVLGVALITTAMNHPFGRVIGVNSAKNTLTPPPARTLPRMALKDSLPVIGLLAVMSLGYIALV